MDVVDAEVGVSAHGRHVKAGPARQPVAGSGERIDHTAIKGKEQQVLETRRQVPARPGLVEDAVAGDRAVVLETPRQLSDGPDVLVLDARTVVPEVGVGLQDGGVDLSLLQEDARGEPIGDGGPGRRAAELAEVDANTWTDVTRVRVLV